MGLIHLLPRIIGRLLFFSTMIIAISTIPDAAAKQIAVLSSLFFKARSSSFIRSTSSFTKAVRFAAAAICRAVSHFLVIATRTIPGYLSMTSLATFQSPLIAAWYRGTHRERYSFLLSAENFQAWEKCIRILSNNIYPNAHTIPKSFPLPSQNLSHGTDCHATRSYCINRINWIILINSHYNQHLWSKT